LRLDSKRHDCGLPSPEIVTVTFSHHGELGSNVTAELAVAEANVRAAIARNTSCLLRARRSGRLIAAANLQPQTRKWHLVSVTVCRARK
jgi:hypothetical protein